jgi:hypothetical protein
MTIKPQGGKVITKGGKVSCECCGPPEPDPPCCPYSPEAFRRGLYTIDDLPDALTYKDAFSEYTIIKQNPPINFGGVLVYYSFPEPGTESVLFLDEDTSVRDDCPGFEDEIAAVWSPGPGISFGYGISCCLTVSPSNSAGLFDQFANSYSIDGPISGTVTRDDLCVWSGTNLRLTNFGFQWKLNGNNKSGFQNTPVGSYAGGFTVS